MLEAARDTVQLARELKIRKDGPLGLRHLETMLKKMETGKMSEGKLGRWLGWMQCAVAATCRSREGQWEMLARFKKLNRKYAERPDDSSK